jgi:hypothetical protein
MPTDQSAQSHAAWDPLYHFVLAPLLLINLFTAIWATIHFWPQMHDLHLAWILTALILFLIAVRLRTYPLASQDRIIRLEEHLRIAHLVPAADASKLTTRQLIALRFASDVELPALVDRTLAENLDPKTIKQSIAAWRADHQRI